MRLQRLYLKDFRNYASQLLDFDEGLHVFYGPNAAGKTNLLEAIDLLASGRSHRTLRDGELIRFGRDSSYLKGRFAEGEGIVDAEVALDREEGKALRANGERVTRISDWTGRLPVVLFFPEDLELAKGGPLYRRTFLDEVTAQLFKVHGHTLAGYQKVLAQRNATLKEVRSRRASRDYLGIWDEQFLDYGARVVLRRLQVLRRMAEKAREQHRRFAADETVELFYQPAGGVSATLPPGDGEEGLLPALRVELARALAESADLEIERGFTVVGPHRDDVEIRLNGRPVRNFASQGQQRSVALSLKLGQLELLREARRGESCILLLDDVFSELDRERQRHLTDEVAQKAQTFVTCTDPAVVGSREGRFYQVEAGRARYTGKGGGP